MRAVSLPELRQRYDAYKQAVMTLASSQKSVPERRSAIVVRDEFEHDVREGMLDGLFEESENWE